MDYRTSRIFQYIPGLKLGLEAHTPPPPFGCPEYKNNNLSMFRKLGRPPEPRETQLDYVSQIPPIVTAPPGNPQNVNIVVIKNLSETKLNGARVVYCLVEPQAGKTPFEAVAKIYDPLYYLFDEFSDEPSHVLMQVDMDYSREAAAYEHLRNSDFEEARQFSPKYYGSWTFRRPVAESLVHQERNMPVRLVLIEYFSQGSLRAWYYNPNPPLSRDQGAQGYPEDFRLAVLADVLDMAVKQRRAGLDQGDLAARNVVLLLGGSEEQNLIDRPRKYALIDYNNSIVYSKSPIMQKFERSTGKPMNPLQVFWADPLTGFEEWQPPEWAECSELRQKWLYDSFGPKGGSLDRYAPLADISKEEVATFLAVQGSTKR